ncbi:WD repeat domain-containing protein [Colletotrichum karsti]|uniref:WD repeat domain-containing protein n=1 Tax=Colletotrichum karsti TaxID=1095194 RepID=A0A9P6LPR3_9PEZI|nr:WD repeat domain-containing protein [Colletotrichum karsti]KAF9880711.1 WD repeat domain-containing protein [Colletotrichum karsti]
MASAVAASDLSTSLSDTDDCPQVAPDLVHNLKHDSSVLCLAVSAEQERIYAGTQDGEIVVWSLATFHQERVVQAHKRSVLSLFLSQDGTMLFSSAGDPLINVWCPKTMKRLYEIYSTNDVGDIFSVAYSAQHETVYVGAQNTSIQWVSLSDPNNRVTHDSALHPDRRNHRFFDSRAVGGSTTPRRNDERWSSIPRSEKVVEIPPGALQMFAHYGYVYSMVMAKGPTVLVEPEEEVLISGGGDGTIKLWKLGAEGDTQAAEADREPGLQELMSLGTDDAESVMALAIDGSFLYAGKLHGIIELWDLDTKSKLRVIKGHKGDVMTLQMSWGYLLSASRAGSASKHTTVHYGKYQDTQAVNISQKYQCIARWKAHEGKVLASAVTTYKNKQYYITGANDNDVAIWHIDCTPYEQQREVDLADDVMIKSLSDFVSYRTVSSRPEFAEDCRKGATFLGSLFKRLGGQVEMLSTESNPHNPVVLAKFQGNLEPAEKRKKILFYGHYDVVPADTKKGKWQTDPFKMKGFNGYLYGRGVSDNKGPIMAALFAVTDLLQAKKLANDIIFLIEGEEESASRGFREIVRTHKDLIGDVDYILLANSYWLDDEVPCLTYGLRGVLHATVCVDSHLPDLHSGVDGSYMNNEPLSDLTSTMSKLKGPKNKVLIPGFYDNILPVTAEEETRYDEIASTLMRQNPEKGPEDKLKTALMARWREPNLTIHRYKVSGPDGSLVSSHASANISMRLVPGQEVNDVIASLTSYLESEFQYLESKNSLTIKIDNKAEPWLGDPSNEIFQALEEAIIKSWGPVFDAGESTNGHENGEEKKKDQKPKKPLYIREGGSIPAIRFLEKEFGAPAAHLPCGQSSDGGHLDNERLRVLNLLKSREIMGSVFARLSEVRNIMEYKRQSPTAVKVKPRLIIHGGAGNIKPANLAPPQYAEYRAALLTIVSKTNAYMTTPLTTTTTTTGKLPTALETATHAVTLLENNPLFNSGHGAVFTRDGINELEASVMVSRGFKKRGVGVTGLRRVRNPILLAKAMLEHGEEDLGGNSHSGHPSSSVSADAAIDAPSAQGHTLLHGPTAEVLARKYGLELVDPGYFFTQRRWDEHVAALERERRGEGLATWSREEFLPQGTVGAVALDEEGVVCAATSTGGLTNKLTGRIGDTPSVGAGFWAEEWEEDGDPTAVFARGGGWGGGAAVVLSESLRGLVADCLPSLSVYSPVPAAVRTTRSIAASGTGNGDSFWRVAAGRTVGAVARFKPLSGREAVSFVSGPGGELQKSAGDRWRVTGEGEGGIIGIEVAITRDGEGAVVGVRSEILQDFNCNGMYRAWIDDDGLAHAKIYHDDVEEGVDARLFAEKW